MPTGPQGTSDDAADADFWRRQAETWQQKVADLEDEVRAMKRPYHFLFHELVHGEIVERSVYKMGEETWPSATTMLPQLKGCPSVVQGGLIFALSPAEPRVDAVKEVHRDR